MAALLGYLLGGAIGDSFVIIPAYLIVTKVAVTNKLPRNKRGLILNKYGLCFGLPIAHRMDYSGAFTILDVLTLSVEIMLCIWIANTYYLKETVKASV